MEPEKIEFALQKTILMSQMMEDEQKHSQQVKQMNRQIEDLQMNSETLKKMETMKQEIIKLKQLVEIKTEENEIYQNTYNKKDHEKIKILKLELQESTFFLLLQ